MTDTTNKPEPDVLALDERTGWPEELHVLLKQYPRESWRQSRSGIALFWLDKHDAFRQHMQMIRSAAVDYREGRTAPADLAAWSAPRLQAFLSALHGHHQIEDFHYFPAFRAAEQRLAPGFDALARDHDLLHQGIVEIVETTNAFLDTLRDESEGRQDAQRHAADRYADACDLMQRRLARHLDDEEDLIIPVMLDGGE